MCNQDDLLEHNRIVQEQMNNWIQDPVKRDLMWGDWTKPTGKTNWKGVLVLVVFILIVLTIFLIVI
jgi:hypothetical protein